MITDPLDRIRLALAVLNLLLVVVGALLAYFDWTSARTREILYLSFTEERPGASYWDTARRQRGQYSHLLIAFLLLIIPCFVTAVSTVSQAPGGEWPLLLYCLEMLGWAWLAFGFLYSFSFNARHKTGGILALLAMTFVIGCFIFSIVMSLHLFGDLQSRYLFPLEVGLRFLLVAAVVGFTFRYRGQAAQPGLLVFDPAVLAFAAVIWFVGSAFATYGVGQQPPATASKTSSSVKANKDTAKVVQKASGKPLKVPTGIPAAAKGKAKQSSESPDATQDETTDSALGPLISVSCQAIAYMLLITLLAHGVLTEYEGVERSRHRMGRERQVIFKFLQRSGAAFTTAVELNPVLDIILETALEATEAHAGAIYLYRTDSHLLEPEVWNGFFPPMYVDTPAALSPHRSEELEEEMRHQAFRLGEGVLGEVAQTGQAQIISDVKAEGVMLGTTAEYLRNRSLLVVPLRIRDEPLGVMAVLNKPGGFGKDEKSLLQALADQGALAINNAMLTLAVGRQERLDRELQIARDIQQRLLPKQCPIIPGFEIAARATSATEVGGDYYDFFWVDDDHLGIMVADVSGKGVHAALVVAMIRSAFRTQAHGNPDVGDVLSRVNEFMSQDLRRDMFITCVYGILEISSRRFSWARAGHEPIIVAHASNEVEILSPEGFALGVIGSPEFRDLLEVQTFQLSPGDRVWIYTDGLTEAMNPGGEEFGLERILKVISHAEELPYQGSTNGRNGHAPVVPCATLDEAPQETPQPDESPCGPGLSSYDPEDLKAMDHAVRVHVSGAAQSDDLTIVYLSTK